MTDTLKLQFSWTQEWLDGQFAQLLPETLTLGKSQFTIIRPWLLRSANASLQTQGQISADYHWKPTIRLLGQLSITAKLKLLDFPRIELTLEEAQFIDTPKVKILGIGIPIKKRATKALEERLPELEKMLNSKIQERVKAELLQLPDRLVDYLPADLLLIWSGMRWSLFPQGEPSQMVLNPAVSVASAAGDSRLELTVPFQQESKPIEIKYLITTQQINDLLQAKVKGLSFDTPAGEFKIEAIQIAMVEQAMQIQIDFEKDKNGQMTLDGYPEIQENGKRMVFLTHNVHWNEVSIIKQGLFSLFEKLVKKKLNQALSMDAIAMADLVGKQISDTGNDGLQSLGGRIKKVALLPTFKQVELGDEGILLAADLSGTVATHFE